MLHVSSSDGTQAIASAAKSVSPTDAVCGACEDGGAEWLSQLPPSFIALAPCALHLDVCCGDGEYVRKVAASHGPHDACNDEDDNDEDGTSGAAGGAFAERHAWLGLGLVRREASADGEIGDRSEVMAAAAPSAPGASSPQKSEWPRERLETTCNGTSLHGVNWSCVSLDARETETLSALLSSLAALGFVLHSACVRFPPPFPKARHAHRRVVRAPLLRCVHAHMTRRGGGRLLVCSDNVQTAHAAEMLLESSSEGEATVTADGVSQLFTRTRRPRHEDWPPLTQAEARKGVRLMRYLVADGAAAAAASAAIGDVPIPATANGQRRDGAGAAGEGAAAEAGLGRVGLDGVEPDGVGQTKVEPAASSRAAACVDACGTSLRAVDYLLRGESVRSNRHLAAFASAPYLRDLLAEPRCDSLWRRSSKSLRKELIEAYSVVEALRDRVLRGRTPGAVVDLCSGKGYLSLVLAHEFPTARVIMVDSNAAIRAGFVDAYERVQFVRTDIMATSFRAKMEAMLAQPCGGKVDAAQREAFSAAGEEESARLDGAQQTHNTYPTGHQCGQLEPSVCRSVHLCLSVGDCGDGVCVRAAVCAVGSASPRRTHAPPRRAHAPPHAPPQRPLSVCLGIHLCGALAWRAVDLYAQIGSCDALILVPCCLDKRADESLKRNARVLGRDPHHMKVDALRSSLERVSDSVLLLRDGLMRTQGGAEGATHAKDLLLVAQKA